VAWGQGQGRLAAGHQAAHGAAGERGGPLFKLLLGPWVLGGQGQQQGVQLGGGEALLKGGGEGGVAGQQLLEAGGGQQQGLHLAGGAQVFAGLLAQQARPAGDGAGAEPLDGAQALAAGGGGQAAQLAAADQQHARGQHIGPQHGLAEAEAAGL
jgi:hypothetical protein